MGNLLSWHSFEGEVVKKYDKTIYECFGELFCWLPLAHTINSKIIVVHGGLFSKDGVTLDDIKKIQRNQEPPEQGKFQLI
jgi:serine/threonine-protein phosphatase 5